MLRHEPDTPAERVAPAAGYTRVDQRVQRQAFRHPQPGHDRNTLIGKQFPASTTDHAPGDLAIELALGVTSDVGALITGVLPECVDAGYSTTLRLFRVGSRRLVCEREGSDNQYLVTVAGDINWLAEPVIGNSGVEPVG